MKYTLIYCDKILFFAALILLNSCQQPQMNFTINNENTKIDIHAGRGGRIAQIHFNGKQVLSPKGDLDDFYGSVWWPSPQDQWSWPPPKTLNNLAYDTVKIINGYKLTSQKCEESGLQLTKEIKQFGSNHIQITYKAKNITDEINKVAHWEVTRLSKNGRVVFPAGTNYNTNALPDSKPTFIYPTNDNPLNNLRDASKKYFDFNIYNDDVLGDGIRKINADVNGGWSAYLQNGLILIKVIKDIPLSSVAPYEGEVQVYISPDLPYVEFEQQGAYEKIAPNETSEWTMNWLIFDYPIKDTPVSELNLFIEQKIEEFGLLK